MSTRAEQMTVARPVIKEGIGLHTGADCALTLRPAESDAGIIFVCGSGVEVPATVENVVESERCTALGRGAARVLGVEHLLGTLYALGVDNARVEVKGPEVPACDGSAREWVSLVREAGLSRLGAPRREISLRAAVWAGEGAAWAVATPARGLWLAVGVQFDDTVVGRQTLALSLTEESFEAELAPARTFARREELEALRAAGLAKGGGAENAFAVGPEGYSGPLRFPDEVVRHKALDLVGDLALCGWRLEAYVTAIRPGHRTNVELARKIRAASLMEVGPTVRGEEKSE